jgi:hypothetical protein
MYKYSDFTDTFIWELVLKGESKRGESFWKDIFETNGKHTWMDQLLSFS